METISYNIIVIHCDNLGAGMKFLRAEHRSIKGHGLAAINLMSSVTRIYECVPVKPYSNLVFKVVFIDHQGKLL